MKRQVKGLQNFHLTLHKANLLELVMGESTLIYCELYSNFREQLEALPVESLPSSHKYPISKMNKYGL